MLGDLWSRLGALFTTGRAHTNIAAADAVEGPVPLLVRVLAGNSVTSATVLACLNTADARHLRQLHPAVAGVVATVPWADTDTPVADAVRWRAAFPAAVGARLTEGALEWKWLTRLTMEPVWAALGGIARLDLHDCEQVTDKLILRLPASLYSLNVRRCRNLTPDASFTHLTTLASLDCSWTRVLRKRSDGLPLSLQELSIIWVYVLGEGVSLAHLRQLRVLHADGSRPGVLTLASLPPSLEELHATGCWELPPAASFAHLTALRRLVVVNSAFSDAMLATLPPSLACLHARGARLTAAAMLPHLPALRLLDMSGAAVGDALVASLPASLTELRLAFCPNVTAGASLDHLRALRLLHCIDTGLAPAALAGCRAHGCAVPASRQLRGQHYQYAVNALAPLADGRLASGDQGGEVRLWAGSEAIAVMRPPGGDVCALAALRDGRRLAIGTASRASNDGCVQLWDVGGVPPARRRAAITCDCGVYALAVLPDGRLAAGCADGVVRVVDVDTSSAVVVATLAGHAGGVTALTVLLDGALASGSTDASVRVWDVGARACVATLTGHTDEMSSLAVLADGRLASGSHDGTVRLWDVATRSCVGVLKGHAGGWVTALAALPDGRLATAAGSEDGTVQLWDTRLAVAAGASHAASAVPVESVGLLVGGRIRDLLSLPDGRLACACRTSAGGAVYWLALPPPVAYYE